MRDISPRTFCWLSALLLAFATGVLLLFVGAWAKTNGLGPWKAG